MAIFEKISVGDKVIKHYPGRDDRDDIETVVRVTKTTFTTTGFTKVRKSDGKNIGDDLFSSFCFKPATAENEAEITARNLKKNLLDQIHVRLFNYGSGVAYPNEVLSKIIDLLDENIKRGV